MTKNRDEEKARIINLLKTLQEGYSRRAVSSLERYASELFVQGADMRILGTSDGEWSLGYEESKGLLESDWKYWGSVLIDTGKVDLSVSGDVAWFDTAGTVEQDFSISEATYDAFVGNVKSYLDDAPCWLGEISDETRLTTIAWELTHLLTGQGKRYRWDLRLSGVAVKIEMGWRFTQLQFSMPTTSRYPDERFWPDNVYEKSHQQASLRLKEYNEQRHVDPEIRTVLERFNRDFSNPAIPSKMICEEFFSKETDARWIGTGTDKYRGAEELSKAIDCYRGQWESLRIGIEEAVMNERAETAWLMTQGEARTTRTRQDAIKYEMEKAREILDTPLTSREKLHRVNRNIITMVNELSKGEVLEWPVRFEAVMVKENGRWVIHYLQFSYPANIVLEGKTDAALEVP